MSARADTGDPGAVRRRQLLLFSAIAAALLVAVAAWLGTGGGKGPAPRSGIEAEIAGPDAAEQVWTRRSEARLGGIETQLREMRQEARTVSPPRTTVCARGWRRTRRTRDAVIDRQAAMIGELERAACKRPRNRAMRRPERLSARPGSATSYFRAPGTASPAPGPAGAGRAGVRARSRPRRMIETFELEGEPQSLDSGRHDSRSGPELVADAVAKPVSAWLPAGAHAEAVVLAGVDASAGVSSQGDPRPVLMRITGPAWTAAEDGMALSVDVDGCTGDRGGARRSLLGEGLRPVSAP